LLFAEEPAASFLSTAQGHFGPQFGALGKSFIFGFAFITVVFFVIWIIKKKHDVLRKLASRHS
jgi:hypothetical protein